MLLVTVSFLMGLPLFINSYYRRIDWQKWYYRYQTPNESTLSVSGSKKALIKIVSSFVLRVNITTSNIVSILILFSLGL